MKRTSKKNPRPSALFEAVEPRQMFSGSPDGFSVLGGINVQEGMYVPGHKFNATVSLLPFVQGLDGLPVKLSLSRDRHVGNGDDIVLGTSNVTTTSWPGVSYTISTAGFTVTLPESLKDGKYYVVASSDDGSQTVGQQITVTTPKPGTDLAVNYGAMFQYLWPENDGSPVAGVRNDGTVESGPWKMAVYLSKDKVLGNGDDILLTSGTPAMGGDPLGAAETVSAMMHYDRQSKNIPDGIYYPIFVADPDNQIAETDETNNVFVADPIMAGPHGSQVGATSVNAATRTDAGSTLSVDVTTKAVQGMGQRNLYFELLAADGTTYRLGGGLTLPAADGHVDLTVPADVPAGEYQLRTMCDIGDMTTIVLVDDRDPTTVGPTVWVGMDAPVVTDPPPTTPEIPDAPEMKPLKVATGSTGRVPLVVSNKQKQAVRRDYNVTFYLSDDATLSADDRKVSKSHAVAHLGAGQSKALVATYQLPKGVKLGTQYLIAVANPTSGTTGSSAKALKAAGPGPVQVVVPVNVIGAKLTASVRSVRPVAGQPGTERVTVRISNTGAAAFNGTATVRLLTDSDSPTTLVTTSRVLNVKAGKHLDITLTVADAAAGFRAVVS